MKRCPGCSETKPREAFNRCLSAASGLQTRCKLCKRRDAANWRSRNREKVRLRKRECYQRTKERICAQRKTQYWSNPEEARAAKKRQRLANPEALKSASDRYSKANRDKLAAKCRAYYLNNKERFKEAGLEWREKNPDRRRVNMRRWKKNNPEKVADSSATRRARIAGARVERISRLKIAIRDNWTCHLCGLKVEKPFLSLDHIIPLSHGGSHTEDNLAIAHVLGNARRGAQPLNHAKRTTWCRPISSD